MAFRGPVRTIWREAICKGPYSKLRYRWLGPATDKPRNEYGLKAVLPRGNRDLALSALPPRCCAILALPSTVEFVTPKLKPEIWMHAIWSVKTASGPPCYR